MWQSICSKFILVVRKEKKTGSISAFCFSSSFQLIVSAWSLGGVPVFNLPMGKSKPYRKSAKLTDALSPFLPPEKDLSPICIFPFKKVPVVNIIDFA